MFTDINERNCWEAGEVDEYPDWCARVNPSPKELQSIKYDFNEFLEEIALKWFQPDELERFNDDDWDEFRGKVGIY